MHCIRLILTDTDCHNTVYISFCGRMSVYIFSKLWYEHTICKTRWTCVRRISIDAIIRIIVLV